MRFNSDDPDAKRPNHQHTCCEPSRQKGEEGAVGLPNSIQVRQYLVIDGGEGVQVIDVVLKSLTSWIANSVNAACSRVVIAASAESPRLEKFPL